MPRPTPFHARTAPLCLSHRWKDWAGFYAVCAYDAYPDREYMAFRHAVGMIDVSPLYKYEITGRDAERFLSRLMVRDAAKIKPGQVAYTCWCNAEGHIEDDGAALRLGESHFRLTANQPSISWLSRHSRGYDVNIQDSSDQIAVLSVQGPNSRTLLSDVADCDLAGLRFFRSTPAKITRLPATPSRPRNGAPFYTSVAPRGESPSAVGAPRIDALISRTGYTGDLGYEVWVANEDALDLWDTLMAAGKAYGLQPAALDAMDITRIEAGFVLAGVDYYHASKCLIDKRKSTPAELGFDWMVALDRGPFIGQDALAAERQRGPSRVLVGLEIDWDEHVAAFAEHGLPMELSPAAWRVSVPVYAAGGLNPRTPGRQIGYATSGVWSPILKKNLALATLEAPYAKIGAQVRFEVTVEYERRTVKATVAPKPFFDPPRKKG